MDQSPDNTEDDVIELMDDAEILKHAVAYHVKKDTADGNTDLDPSPEEDGIIGIFSVNIPFQSTGYNKLLEECID